MFSLGTSSRNNIKDVEPQLILIVEEALKVSPIDFGVPSDGGKRTAERQNEMYLDPNIETNCDGYNNISNHQTGNAFDVFAYVNGMASWDKVHLAIVAGVILATAENLYNSGHIDVKIRWGGTFGSSSFDGWDMPHFEVIK